MFESIYSCYLPVYAEIYDLPHLFIMTVTCERDTYSLHCTPPSPQVFPTAPLVVVYFSAAAAVNHSHSDMLIAMVTCVWPRARAFLSETSMACLRQSAYKRAAGIKNRHHTHFLSVSGFIITSLPFATLWSKCLNMIQSHIKVKKTPVAQWT